MKKLLMDIKENVLRIIKFDNPERVLRIPPLDILYYYGGSIADNDEGVDAYAYNAKWVDPWGVCWHNAHKDVLGMPVKNPIPEPKDLKNYTWLNPNDERVLEKIYQLAEKYPNEDRFLAGSHHHTIWERAYMLVGMENLLLYFYTEPEFVKEIFYNIMDIHLSIAEHYLKLGVELVRTSDDLGTQSGSFLSCPFQKCKTAIH